MDDLAWGVAPQVAPRLQHERARLHQHVGELLGGHGAAWLLQRDPGEKQLAFLRRKSSGLWGMGVQCGVLQCSGQGDRLNTFLGNVIVSLSLPKKLMDSKRPDWQKGERLIKF